MARVIVTSPQGVPVEVEESGVDALVAAGFTRPAEPEKRHRGRKADEKD